MSKHLPPVPPAAQSDKGPGSAENLSTDTSAKKGAERNYDQQGRQGNSKINTTHPGYQQDR